MLPIDIRLASQADLADIQFCAKLAYEKYVVRIGREPAPMHADFAKLINDGHVCISMFDSQFAGYVVFYSGDTHVHLENIAVLPELSGRGIGKALIKYVENIAISDGYQSVQLYTNEAMTENLAMYPKLGYVEIARKQEDGFNRVFFHKPL
ncbi:GNAT family N-acetyltransferase [Marinomonas sp.]|uniref:GNAT family N-acetyltransferase n=1 Tax=Marinomonas sp. TaxID=1904862 RepID=UPI003BACD10C